MILGFKQQFPWGERTWFREKILLSVLNGPGKECNVRIGEESYNWAPKLHTIRAGNRWKAGDLIHMAYGVRTKEYEQFNKGIEGLQRVVSVQYVELRWIQVHMKRLEVLGGGKEFDTLTLPQARFSKDDDWYPGYCAQVKDLARNDGFDSIDDFWKWFDRGFEGQIVHWTNLKYL